jgi:hypothetical protein
LLRVLKVTIEKFTLAFAKNSKDRAPDQPEDNGDSSTSVAQRIGGAGEADGSRIPIKPDRSGVRSFEHIAFVFVC